MISSPVKEGMVRLVTGNFLNKGKGYAYCLYSKDSRYYLSLWVTEATKRNDTKHATAILFEEKFVKTFANENNNAIKEKIEIHQISKSKSDVKQVDVTIMDDGDIVHFMAILSR